VSIPIATYTECAPDYLNYARLQRPAATIHVLLAYRSNYLYLLHSLRYSDRNIGWKSQIVCICRQNLVSPTGFSTRLRVRKL